jgi:hypothetical protein
VHWTGGYAPRFQAFSYVQADSVKMTLSRPTRQPVTHTVSRSNEIEKHAETVTNYNISQMHQHRFIEANLYYSDHAYMIDLLFWRTLVGLISATQHPTSRKNNE